MYHPRRFRTDRNFCIGPFYLYVKKAEISYSGLIFTPAGHNFEIFAANGKIGDFSVFGAFLKTS